MARRTLLMFRWGVLLAAGAWLWFHVAGDQSTHGLWGDLRTAMGGTLLGGTAMWFWPCMLALTLLNWGLEAVKWRRLVAGLEPVPFRRAFAATLAGTTMGLFTPNRSGEQVGRVLFLSPQHRWAGGFATLLGSMAQLTATVVMGTLALAWWQGTTQSPAWPQRAGLPLAALVGLGTMALYLRPALLGRFVRRVPLLRRAAKSVDVLERFSSGELLGVLGISLLRYLVFGGQYVLFLYVLAGISWSTAMLAVPMIFLVVTLVPTMLLSEMGVRGSVAVALLAPLGGAPALVLLASFAVWAVNLALPALAGLVIMLVARIRTRA